MARKATEKVGENIVSKIHYRILKRMFWLFIYFFGSN